MWIKKTESIFETSLCVEENKVKFVACTFMDAELSWWNGHTKTLVIANVNSLSWVEVNKMMIEEYFPQEEM